MYKYIKLHIQTKTSYPCEWTKEEALEQGVTNLLDFLTKINNGNRLSSLSETPSWIYVAE